MTTRNKKNVLIIDDDTIIRNELEKELKRNFYNTFLSSEGKAGLKIFESENIEIVILDVKLPDINGIDVLQIIKSKKPDCEVIIMTGYGTQEIAIQSLRRGAIDYIEKPLIMDELYTALGRAEENLIAKEGLDYKSSILIIDDEEEIARQLKRTLQKEGYIVFVANNGKKGLEIIETNKIDVVVTDIMMEDINGIEVLKKAKTLYHDIEGIMITGFQDRDFAIKSLRAGAFDYITKPIDLDNLLFSIKKAIERIHLHRNRLYRNRELKISSDIISKMNEELERRIQERSREVNDMQVQLFQTSKLATLGEMSAGLAHEINQPLGGISLVAASFRKLMARELLTPEEIESGLDDIETSVQRMTKVIQHIRTFARQDLLEFIQVDVNATLESAMGLLSEQLRLHEITVERNYAPDLPKIVGEPFQLEQVWINLITNARDAVDEKGKQDPEYEKLITISTSYDPGLKRIIIRVRDNGQGMPEEVRKKIFEPFFTTKEVGKATGLGLAISYGIIQEHQGSIELETNDGEGITISVLLPLEVEHD